MYMNLKPHTIPIVLILNHTPPASAPLIRLFARPQPVIYRQCLDASRVPLIHYSVNQFLSVLGVCLLLAFISWINAPGCGGSDI